jgi:acyl-coenzyme A thioesterase 13
MLAFFQSQIGQPLQNSLSPFSDWLGSRLTEVGEGKITLSLLIRPEMTNPARILHGGVAAAILDDVMGMTVYTLGKEFIYVTVSLSVDFLDNAREGETIFAQSQIIRNGKTLIHAEGKLTNEAGKILVKATSNLIASRIPQPSAG